MGSEKAYILHNLEPLKLFDIVVCFHNEGL